MRNALVGVVIAAATVFAITPAASAATHCPDVTLDGTTVIGGCVLHVSGSDIELRKHVFGIESHITKCNWEFSARLDEGAFGFITAQALTNASGGGSCTRQPCKDGGGNPIPWTASGSEVGVGSEVLSTTFCVEPTGGGTDETCNIDLPWTTTGTDQYQLGQVAELAGGTAGTMRCEVIAILNSEIGGTDERVEMSHV